MGKCHQHLEQDREPVEGASCADKVLQPVQMQQGEKEAHPFTRLAQGIPGSSQASRAGG